MVVVARNAVWPPALAPDLVDLATTELRAGNLADASRHAITAADLIHTITYATGAIRLRAFRAIAAQPLDPPDPVRSR